MKTYFIILSLFFNFGLSFGQPSCVMGLEFKVFKNEKIVKYDSLKANYQLIDVNDNQSYLGFRNFGADGINNTISFLGGTGCHDLKMKIVFKKDTMLLNFKYHAKKDFELYAIDTLIFKKGKYYIQENKLEKINFEKSATDYYNEQIKLALKLKKMRPDFKELKFYKDLSLLKKEYNIAIDDYEEKTEIELFPKRVKR